MTRAEKVAEAQRLRDRGLLKRQIAERMGVAITTVDAWLNDPDLSKQRARRENYRGTCVDCGASTDGSGGKGKASRRCRHCDVANRLVPAAQEASRALRARVERLWAEGLTSPQIEAIIGSTGRRGAYIPHCRSRGFDLPHRRTGEWLANLQAAGRRNIVVARGAKTNS